MKKLALLRILAVLISSAAILTRVQVSNPKALPLAASWQDGDQSLACIVVVGHGREFQSIVASPQPIMVSTTGRKVR